MAKKRLIREAGRYAKDAVRKMFMSFSKLNQETLNDDFPETEKRIVSDAYLQDAWVANCVDLIARNVGRADFVVMKEGKKVNDSAAARLFEFPSPVMSRYELWQRTAAWWSLEGEAFWYFGNEYTTGVPKELHVMNPRKMNHVLQDGNIVKWIYEGDRENFVILPNEMIHFKRWNPYNHYRGLSPLVCMIGEIGEDVLASNAYKKLLKSGGIPKGLLKTDQTLTETEAEMLERRWEEKFNSGGQGKVAVLGRGTEYQQLTFSPDVLKLYEMKKWNLYTILARFGIPPRVANIEDKKASLSGTDTDSQHAAFWNYTLIPMLNNFEQIVDAQFFKRFHLRETGVFDLEKIPELQESENAKSNRDIEEIKVGLRTVNEVLEERGLKPKPWGDKWYRESRLVCED